MDGEQSVATLEQFLAERGEPLLHTAILLAGSRAGGEDLLQSALERLVSRWKKIEDSPEGYVRTTLYNLAVDGWRRETSWRARLGLIATHDAVPDEATAVDDRDAIIRLLHQLTPRQRTVIVLRYWEDLTEAQTAKAMGCRVGTVKATTSRALQRLRELSAPVDDPPSAQHAIKLHALTSTSEGSPA